MLYQTQRKMNKYTSQDHTTHVFPFILLFQLPSVGGSHNAEEENAHRVLTTNRKPEHYKMVPLNNKTRIEQTDNGQTRKIK